MNATTIYYFPKNTFWKKMHISVKKKKEEEKKVQAGMAIPLT